jgi:flagellar hook-associated protein 3 FlgL
MVIPVVSSYSVLQRTLDDVSKVQNDLIQNQIQLSSGKKSQDFTGMADQVQDYLSLDGVISKINQYLADNQLVETRVNTTSNALSNILTTSNNLLNLISQRRTGVSNSGAFPNQLRGLWQQLTGELNTQVNGQYIFSGTKTTTPAVDTENFPSLLQENVPDTGYYRGSQQDMTAIAQDNVIIKYNVRADSEGIQKVFAGLAMAEKGAVDLNDDALEKAYTLVQQGIQDIISTQALVNSNKVQYTTINQGLQNQKLYWQGIRESIGNTDMVSVSTQVAINQGILQAAFQAFAKISALRLSDFLR